MLIDNLLYYIVALFQCYPATHVQGLASVLRVCVCVCVCKALVQGFQCDRASEIRCQTARDT